MVATLLPLLSSPWDGHLSAVLTLFLSPLALKAEVWGPCGPVVPRAGRAGWEAAEWGETCVMKLEGSSNSARSRVSPSRVSHRSADPGVAGGGPGV